MNRPGNDRPAAGPRPFAPLVLLVEDNPSDVQLTRRAFARTCAAAVVEVVRDGQEALDYLFRTGTFVSRLADRDPDLVLLDLKLPRIEGLAVLQAVKGDARTRGIPVVVLSTSVAQLDLAAAYAAGANSCLQKPLDYPVFQEMIGTLARYWLELNEPPRGRGDRTVQGGAHGR